MSRSTFQCRSWQGHPSYTDRSCPLFAQACDPRIRPACHYRDLSAEVCAVRSGTLRIVAEAPGATRVAGEHTGTREPDVQLRSDRPQGHATDGSGSWAHRRFEGHAGGRRLSCARQACLIFCQGRFFATNPPYCKAVKSGKSPTCL